MVAQRRSKVIVSCHHQNDPGGHETGRYFVDRVWEREERLHLARRPAPAMPVLSRIVEL